MEAPFQEAGYPDDALIARRRRRVLIAIGVVVIVLIVGFFLIRGRSKPAPQADTSPRVTVTIPGHQQVGATINASGIIGARHDMPVGAVGEGGMVTQVLVNPGDWVKQGQTLAIVERSVQTQQAAGSAASLRSAEADAALAASNLKRAQALVGNGFISKADIDTKIAARDQANARVALARAQLGEQNARNGRLTIRAPGDGLVLTRAVEPGQIVGNGAAVLFRIAEHGDMEMQVRVAEQDLAQIHIGTAVQVTPVGSTTALSGQVWQLSPVIDPTMRQGVIRVALQYAPSLRPGGFASAAISGGKADVPVLPESAVLSDAIGNYVYIVGTDNRVVRRNVKVGGVDDRGVSIASGLTGTERVVTSAGAFLNPNDKITPQLAAASR